jgi:hypothetical protein
MLEDIKKYIKNIASTRVETKQNKINKFQIKCRWEAW